MPVAVPGRRIRLPGMDGRRPMTDDEALAEQAAEWIVQLTADDVAERARAREGFEAWKRADPRHGEVAASLEDVVQGLQGVRTRAGGSHRPARAALDAAAAGRAGRGKVKRAVVALAVVCGLALPFWLVLTGCPPAVLLADLRAGGGEWPVRTLADGSRVAFNGAGAVNLHYDARRRVVELLQGEILVDVARDAARPFVVETAHGSIRALGTRFVVRRDDDATTLTMLESTVSVRSAAAPDAVTLVSAGQRLRLAAGGLGPLAPIDARSVADAWRQRSMVVEDRPLPEVLDELARHRPGLIEYDRASLQGVRVSAVLPLDDTDRALQLLRTSFPGLRVRTWTRYLVLVDRP
jgi:transmembrane sensor